MERVTTPGRAVEILRDLVSIESVNPYFPGGERGEGGMTAYLARFFFNLGLQVEQREVLAGRANVWTRLDALGTTSTTGERPTLLLETHMDTVTLEPTGPSMVRPVERDGRLYARGACDDKGALAAMLAALEGLVAHADRLRADVIVLGSVDEEYLMRGIAAFATSGPRVDAAVVGEPTSLNVVRAHKGLIRWTITTRGRSAHTSNPEKGVNAIYQMLTLVDALRRDLEPGLAEVSHPLLTPPTLTVSTIHGGTAVNIVPDTCSIEIDRRTLPNEQPDAVIAELERVVAQVRRDNPGLEVTVGPPFATIGGIDTPEASPIVRIAAEASERVAGRGGVIGVPYGTNAAALAGIGVPVVVLGPGDIAQAHTADEWVEFDQVDWAAEIYAQIALGFPAADLT